MLYLITRLGDGDIPRIQAVKDHMAARYVQADSYIRETWDEALAVARAIEAGDTVPA